MYHDHFSETLADQEVQQELNKLDWQNTDIYLYCNLPGKDDSTFQIKRKTIAFLSAIKRILLTN